MFEVTGEDISNLNDVDLRTLVVKLCEAELRRVDLPVSALTAGGDQNAPDGGLDVRIALNEHDKQTDFIPRPNTGFQVKVPDMPRSAILEEMAPDGNLRPVIQELVRKQGAYVIVSSHGSTADGPLQNRVLAMQATVEGVPGLPAIHLDFYDRDRLAIWVRQYPGVSLWVQTQLGKSTSGWQGYGNWSGRSEQIGTEYLLDEKCRLYDAQDPKGGQLTVEEGLNRLRKLLSKPGSVVRLIGLSGVGKTRFVEALFDSRVGENALDTANVIYTDMADEPSPSPRDMIHRFVQSAHRVIVVVDNCPPSTHQALAKMSSSSGSSASILTVEYDVGEDEPEGTEVFRLEGASEEVIENLIERAAPYISQINRRSISEFSGGNSRIALALVKSIDCSESVAKLSDEDLFQRLFRQRRSEDSTLLRAAEACSLVYSFDGEVVEGQEAELPILAKLAELSVPELFRNIQELKERELVQQRSKWRAVLPHALANKLAQRALGRTMPTMISAVLVSERPGRLLKSFSHRLGYLHYSDKAQALVGEWLSEGGLLGQVDKLNPLELDMLRNVAPVNPEATLAALERSLGIPGGVEGITPLSERRYKIAALIANLAFDAGLFERASALLARFVIAEAATQKFNSTRGVFDGLFQLYLSGTHASVQQRLNCIDTLLSSPNTRCQTVGLGALERMLEPYHFSSTRNFEFGARPRDFGWEPTTHEAVGWFRAVLMFVLQKIISGHKCSCQLKSLMATNFRGILTKWGMLNELEELAEKIIECESWPDGWLCVREVIKDYAAKMQPEVLERIKRIENLLRPKDLLEQSKACVLLPQWSSFEFSEVVSGAEKKDFQTSFSKVDTISEELGKVVAVTPDVFSQLLPDLVKDSHGRGVAFGIGLAQGATNLHEMWEVLKTAFTTAPELVQTPMVLRGFLIGASQRSLKIVSSFLDSAVSDPALGKVFPFLQCAVEIGSRGGQRLLESLPLGIVPLWGYKYLCIGGVTASIPNAQLKQFLIELSHRPSGCAVAIEILVMRIYPLQGASLSVPQEFISCGCELLLRYDFTDVVPNDVNNICEILKVCLASQGGGELAQKVCLNLIHSISDGQTSFSKCSRIIEELFEATPLIALDVFIPPKGDKRVRLLYEFWQDKGIALRRVQPAVLIEWANEEPKIRFPELAEAIDLFVSADSSSSIAISPEALQLISAAPDKSIVLAGLEKSFDSISWCGSLSEAYDMRRSALRPLKNHLSEVVVSWACEWDANLIRRAEAERSRERAEDERFE